MKRGNLQALTWADWVLTVNYPSIGKSFKFDALKAPNLMRSNAERHGWKQLFGDEKSGKSAGEKYDAALRRRDSIMSGVWTLKIGPRPFDAAIILEAYARLGQDRAKLEAAFKKGKKTIEEIAVTLKAWEAIPKAAAEDR